MARTLSEKRRNSVLEAIDRIVKENAENVSQVARLLKVQQQTLWRALKMRTVGEMLAEHTAEYFGTTVDGLVRYINQERGPVRAGDIIGWRGAVQEAQRRPLKFEAWVWARAADIVLPAAPDLATPEFAFDLAQLLAKHCEITHVSTKVQSR